MSKKKTGVFDMTTSERGLYMDTVVASNLANHYQNMALKMSEKAFRAQTLFWDTVKGRPNLPKKHCSIEVLTGDRQIQIEIITNKEPEMRYFKKIPSKTEVTKEE